MSNHAYLVIDQDYESYDVKRVYLDQAEAQTFVDAFNATGSGDLEIEEIEIGAPTVDYDGPVWCGTWTQRRKRKGERQLVIVADGFTTVVPSAVPTDRYLEWFAGPGWRDLVAPTEYREPSMWIDSFHFQQQWHIGDAPTPAAVITRDTDEVEVRGTSKDEVEQLLRSTALEMKHP